MEGIDAAHAIRSAHPHIGVVLDVSAAEAGKLSIVRAPLGIDILIADALDLPSHPAAEKRSSSSTRSTRHCRGSTRYRERMLQ